MGFSTERTDYLWWLMVSGDVNANRVVLSMLDQDKWREDMPRLVRGSLGRQQRWTLEHDRGQCLGCAGDGAVRREVRNRSRDRCHARRNWPSRSASWTGASRSEGGSLMFSWPAAAGELEPGAGWHRQAMGHDPEPGRDPAQGAVLVRLSDQAHGVGGGAEGARASGRAAT